VRLIVIAAIILVLAADGLTVSARTAPLDQGQGRCFDTGYCISNPVFLSYFDARGGARILGSPVSREFTLDGFRVQFFQRQVLQLQGSDVARLNLLDSSILPLTRANGSVFPPPDQDLAAAAPRPDSADYAASVLDFLNSAAPDTWNDLPVGFTTLFSNTVPVNSGLLEAPDVRLVTLLNLEVWGLPTSRPAYDPNNHGFVYERFQRGIMHFRVDCNCTDGVLVGDYFKSVITGQNLPEDLDADSRDSRYYRQYDPTQTNWVARADELPNTNLEDAFEPQTGPGSAPASVTPIVVEAVQVTPSPTAVVPPQPTATPVRPTSEATHTPTPTSRPTSTPTASPTAIIPPQITPSPTAVLPPQPPPTPTAIIPPQIPPTATPTQTKPTPTVRPG
jgi:hypothetical protein